MKLYTLKYDYNLPTIQQINTATNSTFLIGVKAVRNGEEVAIDPAKATLVGPTSTLSASSDKVNGYVTFQMSVLDEPSVIQYSLDIEGDTVKDFSLVVNAFKSQVGDIDKDAGGPGTDIDVNSVKTKVLTVNNGSYTVITAESDETENDSGVVNVKGSYAKLRVGGTNDINAVRINADGTTPNVQVGKMGTSDDPCAALSCTTSGHGLLVLDNIAFTGADLSATFAANQILEGLV